MGATYGALPIDSPNGGSGSSSGSSASPQGSGIGYGTGQVPSYAPGYQYANNTGNPLDLPQFGGPYVAPLTSGQLDALQGFNRIATTQPIVQTQDLTNALKFAMSGGPVFTPGAGQTLQQQLAPFTLPSTAQDIGNKIAQGGAASQAPNLTDLSGILPNVTNALNKQLSAPSFDETNYFKNATNLFNNQLNDQLANVREEYSGLGLGPGSSDRATGLARTAGNAIGQFQLGLTDLARQDFENAQNRSISALSQVPGTVNAATTPFQQQLNIATQVQQPNAQLQASVLPTLSQMEQLPFQRFDTLGENAANRAVQTLPFVSYLQQLPFDQMQQQFNINEQARQVADTESQRRMAEYARTQGGMLNQLLAILSGVPLNNTAIGPSFLSQLGSFLGNIGGGAGAILSGLG